MPKLRLRPAEPADRPSFSRAGRALLRLLRGLGALSLILLVLAATVPLLLPIPELRGTRSAASIAADDPGRGRFVELAGLSIYVEGRPTPTSRRGARGQGHGHGHRPSEDNAPDAQDAPQERPPLLLLHGFLSSTLTWTRVLDPLAARGRVVAFDRPAFGLSARPSPPADEANFAAGEDPYSPQAQVAQTLALIDALELDRPILVGSSAGGALALRVALARPDRVRALVLIAPALAGGGGPPWLRALLDTPQVRRLGPLLARGVSDRQGELFDAAWHDPSLADSAYREAYTRGLRVDGWDEALWRYTLAYRGAEELLPRVAQLELPILVITGDDDRIVDPAQSEALAAALVRADAELVTIGACGHLPQEECPAQTLAAIDSFVDRLRQGAR